MKKILFCFISLIVCNVCSVSGSSGPLEEDILQDKSTRQPQPLGESSAPAGSKESEQMSDQNTDDNKVIDVGAILMDLQTQAKNLYDICDCLEWEYEEGKKVLKVQEIKGVIESICSSWEKLNEPKDKIEDAVPRNEEDIYKFREINHCLQGSINNICYRNFNVVLNDEIKKLQDIWPFLNAILAEFYKSGRF